MNAMEKLYRLQRFLENLDSYRDKALFVFIKPYWPRIITPNHVTYLRAIISIALFVLLFVFANEDKTLITSLFIIGVLTDFIDCPVARGTNRVTEFGALLDSSTDRLLIFPIAIYSLMQSHIWLLTILILVEVVNAIVSLYYKSKEIYLESNIFGKVKMVLLCIPFIVMLLLWPNTLPAVFLYMLWITIPFSLLSAFSKILELRNKHAKSKDLQHSLQKERSFKARKKQAY